MAVSSDPFVAADLAAFIPEVWTPIILEQMFAKMVASNFFTDLSSYMANGGDIAHVPDVYTNAFSLQTQSTQGAEITTAGPAQVDVTLTVNTHKYVAHIVGDKDKVQLSRSYDFNGIYASKTGKTVADSLEDDLFALWSGLSTNSVGDTATVITDLEIRTTVNKLASLDFNTLECAFFVHPTIWWTQLAAIQKYYDASMRGSLTPGAGQGPTVTGNFGEAAFANARVGTLYGSPVYQSTNVVSGLQTYRNLFAHPTAFGWAQQTPGGSMVRVQAENKVQYLGFLTVTDIIYGVVELRDAAACVLNGNNSATTA